MTTKKQFQPVDEQIAYLRKGAAEIIREEDLRAKLESSWKTGKPLRVYLGVDPTAPDIHLGHTVVLRKLKHFQDLGHTAIFLIGDFSAMIGDPTGQSETRPPLTREQVDANAKTYLEQVYKLLDPKETEVRFNSEWLGKMTSYDVVRLCGHYRLARMLEREDFRSRLDKNQPISVHEVLYPLLTAYDAVALQSDVEIGATEQKFNLLVHRDIQREYGMASEVAFTMPILVGLDGQRKMSKSLGNYVGITQPPSEMFGRLMSIPDDRMWSYFDLLTDRASHDVEVLQADVQQGKMHPMEVKMSLAQEIVSGFHGADAAAKAAAEFQRIFRDREAPDEALVMTIKNFGSGAFQSQRRDGNILTTKWLRVSTTGVEKWARVLLELEQVSSASEAERLIKGRGFEVNGEITSDPSARVDLNVASSYSLKIGKKKFLRIVVE